MDLALLHEVLRVEPYDGEYATLTLRWKTVAANISAYFEIEIPHRSARDHYESMLETFKSTDRAQQLWGTGSEEEVTEQVELLQNLADRREAKDEAKKAKKEKEQKRRDAMELTGFQLCLEAEQPKDFIGQTDEGLLSAADERFHDPTAPGYLVEVDTIRDKCFKLCKHWDVLEKIIGDRASARPLLRSSNEDDDDYSVDMLNKSTLKSEPDKFGFSSGKKKLNTEFVGKRSFSVGESLMQGLKAQAQSSGIFVSREMLASRAAELELRKENEDRHFMLRKREIDLKANELRHKQIIEEARLISSMSFDNADVTEYFRDGLSKIQ
ncbi:hypothetical protein B5M09_009133 [Aphanomyces astaci]|uniref:Uncharacterized protein n=1 Tax=Aphanomyces astaci TaxID=112090 RepID=A0A3R7WH37_APHAT|nr:hypothetical protein B5M09_009133 [Aphanomyces astaci]